MILPMGPLRVGADCVKLVSHSDSINTFFLSIKQHTVYNYFTKCTNININQQCNQECTGLTH